jgi:hypothetical protein
VRALRYLPAFSFNALRAARQAKTAPGNLAVSLLADANFGFWTRTLWNDQDAMRAFMLSGAHRRMMPRLLNWGATRQPLRTGRRTPSKCHHGRRCTAACKRKADAQT